MIEKIKDIIQQHIPSAEVYVFDPYNDSTHFQAVVVCDLFKGLSLVKQHQMVMNALKQDIASNAVHALGLKTYTPEMWEKDKSNYLTNS